MEKEHILLQYVQTGIPITHRPFKYLGQELQMEERQVMDYLKDWREKGLIRWLGAIFSTQAVGYQSTLAAFSLPSDKVAEAADIINQHPGVTHNYQREHEYNLWFTLAVPPEESLESHVKKLALTSGAEKWINLAVIKMYKIGLVLPIVENGSCLEGRCGSVGDYTHILTEEEKALVRILQEDWPLVTTPYATLAGQGGNEEERLMEKIREWKAVGIIRRVAAILRHREAGFSINWMVAWQVRPEKMDAAGTHAARHPLISHCYQRVITDDWPYPLFTMVHARSEEEARKVVEDLSQLIDPLDFKILPTIREFKKVRLRLFVLK
jgi:DNA-binding Lrp family transcriptional regulator